MDFKLRPWQMDDLESLVQHANNFEVAKNLTDAFPHPYTEADGKAFITMATKADPIHIFAIEVAGRAVGGIGIHPQSDIMKKNAELGYWLGEPYWGKGIITRAIKQMVDFAFKTYDITRVYARPYGTNIGSQKVLEKNGFKLEARIEKNIFKNGEFLDELIYAIRK
ncbi:MAG: GNAT family N-acetyltransferase [Flavobacteriaceae bacterium]|nr:GNAT family N-acetyltransferase [Flavobacteriaceae bacterium]